MRSILCIRFAHTNRFRYANIFSAIFSCLRLIVTFYSRYYVQKAYLRASRAIRGGAEGGRRGQKNTTRCVPFCSAYSFSVQLISGISNKKNFEFTHDYNLPRASVCVCACASEQASSACACGCMSTPYKCVCFVIRTKQIHKNSIPLLRIRRADHGRGTQRAREKVRE